MPSFSRLFYNVALNAWLLLTPVLQFYSTVSYECSQSLSKDGILHHHRR